MIQNIVNCDRCNKFLSDGEGYQYQFLSRSYRNANGILIGPANTEAPLYGEICEGCFNIQYFFFHEKFKEDKKASV